MLKTSNIRSMAQILRDMKNPPVKEDTDKDEPGTQGDKEEYQKKRKEIANKFGVESCSALKDEEKRKACYAALDAAHVSDDEEEDEDDDPVGKNEEVEIDEKFAGWIAMYGGKKLEIKKSEADGIWPAKQLAIKHFKVPKSKQGLLAIKPAHEEVEVDEGSNSKDIATMYALHGRASRASNPKEKDNIVKQLNDVRRKLGKPPIKSSDIKEPKRVTPGGKFEEVEIQEHCGECEMGITEEVSAKEFDALKKGDTVTIEFKSPMSTGKSTFKVTAKNVVGKARIEKVTLKNVKRPNTVKFFLYKRGNKVSLAQGDMAASVVSFTKEGIDIEKASMGAVIKDFQNSDAPQFKGKSDKKRREMAIAAKLSKEENEVNEASMTYRIRKAQQPEIDKMIKSAGMMKLQIQSSIGDIIKMQKGGDVEITVSGTAKNLRKFDAVVRGKSSYGDPSLLKKEQKEVKEAVLDNGIEVGEQDWDLIARNDTVYPNLNVNFAKYIDEGLEGPYDVGGEVYFYDRKVQMFYSVSSEDYVDEETAKDIAYRLHKNGFYKPELGR